MKIWMNKYELKNEKIFLNKIYSIKSMLYLIYNIFLFFNVNNPAGQSVSLFFDFQRSTLEESKFESVTIRTTLLSSVFIGPASILVLSCGLWENPSFESLNFYPKSSSFFLIKWDQSLVNSFPIAGTLADIILNIRDFQFFFWKISHKFSFFPFDGNSDGFKGSIAGLESTQ